MVYYTGNVTLHMQAYESGSVYSGLTQMGYQVSNIDGKGNKTTNEFVPIQKINNFLRM